MIAPFVSGRWAPIAAAALLALAGCTTGASMQVDVEVYKGPLSKNVDVQEAELSAKVEDAQRSFQILSCRARMLLTGLPDCERELPPATAASEARAFAHTDSVEVRRSFFGQSVLRKERSESAIDRDVRSPASPSATAPLCHPDCKRLSFLSADLDVGVQEAACPLPRFGCPPKISVYTEEAVAAFERESWARGRSSENNAALDAAFGDAVEDAAKQRRILATYGAMMRDRAAFWAQFEAASPSTNPSVRLLINDFANIASEAGNQIVARVDAIEFQDDASSTQDLIGVSNGNGKKRDNFATLNPAQRLATSLYLRDSNPTAYLNLYDWNKSRFSTRRAGEFSELDRVRLAEELMRDTYWSKINTVHANGVGDVRMAFIKDDTGNWNLKSFSNDPERLLNAYNDLGRAAISEAVKLATTGGAANAAEHVTKAGKLTEFANNVLIGKSETQPTIGPEKLSMLRARVRQRLADEKKAMEEAKAAPKANAQSAKSRSDESEKERAVAEKRIACLRDHLDQLYIGGPDRTPPAPADTDCKAEVGPEPVLANEADEATVEKARSDRIKALQQKLAVRRDELTKATRGLEVETAKIAAAEVEIKSIEKSAIERARLILRDHGVVVGTLEEVLAPPAEKPKAAETDKNGSKSGDR